MAVPSQDNSITYYEPLDSPELKYIQAELSNWERIVFQSNIMDGSHKQGEDSSDGPHTSTAHTSASVNRVAATVSSTDNVNAGLCPPGHLFHGAPPSQVTPEAYTYLIHALLSMQGAIPPPSNNNQSVSFPQGFFPSPSASPVSPHVPHQSMHSHSPPGIPSTGSHSHFSSSNTPAVFPQHSASFPANAPSDAGDTADEAIAVAEDKRRRNTSASARFRIKKKQKALNLERTVADLTGRTEELEREASELRRENSWLKEIVLLKSGRLGAFGGSQHSSSQQSHSSSSQGRKDGPSSDMIEDSHATHK